MMDYIFAYMDKQTKLAFTIVIPFVLLVAIVFFWAGTVYHKPIAPKPITIPPSPPQLIFFQAGPCQYIMVKEQGALAIQHRGDCSNHFVLHSK